MVLTSKNRIDFNALYISGFGEDCGSSWNSNESFASHCSITLSPLLLSTLALTLALITYTFTQNTLKQMHKILHNIKPILTPQSHLISQAKINAYFLKEKKRYLNYTNENVSKNFLVGLHEKSKLRLFCMIMYRSCLIATRAENLDLQSVIKHIIRVLKSHFLDKHRSVLRNIWIFQDSAS